MQTPTLNFKREKLDALLAAHGLTSDAKLADRLGINTATAWRLRTGKNLPSTTLIARVSSAFPDVPLGDLVEVVLVDE